jgi:hypothetical protein
MYSLCDNLKIRFHTRSNVYYLQTLLICKLILAVNGSLAPASTYVEWNCLANEPAMFSYVTRRTSFQNLQTRSTVTWAEL